MTALKPYSEYKDSGVEWVGEIPKGWEVNRLKGKISTIKNGIWGIDKQNNSNDVSCVRVADFDRNKARVRKKELLIRNIPRNEQFAYILNQGDLLIEKSGGGEKQPVGYTVLYDLDKRAVYTNFMAKITVDQESVDSLFLSFVFETLYSLRINVKSIKQTTGIQNLDIESYLNEKIPIPSIGQQKVITKYLEGKSNAIESLVEDKEHLIELLEGKRQAIITETVTKGLDPNLKMKESGIEWIGDIPEHWGVVKLKYLSDMKSGETITSNNIGKKGEYPVYGGGGFRGYTQNYTHDGDYILIGRQGALCGNINYVSCKFWASEHAIVVTTKKDVDTLWAGLLLETMNLNQYSISAAQPGLSVSTIKNLSVPLPIFIEQHEISEYLLEMEHEINDIKEELILQITKLKEYRESLIYEAVTGKIDLRNYEENESSYSPYELVAETKENYNKND